MTDKELDIEEPWLLENWYLDSWDLPDGWNIAFGNLLAKEIYKAVQKDHIKNFKIYEMKEKYGELRIYHNGGEYVDQVVEAFTVISRNICIECGELDVGRYKNGWILPICKCCYDLTTPKYEDVCTKPKPISTTYTITTADGKKRIDISKYVKKVREIAKQNE